MIKHLIFILIPFILSQEALSDSMITGEKIAKQKEQACARYQRAYPEYIKAMDGDSIIWYDGTRMKVSDGKELTRTFQEKLDNATLLDQLSIPYMAESKHQNTVLEKDCDPGRLRHTNFFKKMYGNTEEEVKENLVTILWLPKAFNGKYKILVTKINGISEKLQQISHELDQLVLQKPEMAEYLTHPGGTFCWRMIAGSDRPSAHSFGMTIDINVAHSNYWLWDYKKEQGMEQGVNVSEKDVDNKKFPIYRNKIPSQIIKIFEKHGFIWGGNWYHYDTMHFEYRPELLVDSLH